MQKVFIFLLSLIANINAQAQSVQIISSKKAYYKAIVLNESNTLVNIKKSITTIQLDLRYATTNNFTKIKLYNNCTTTYLRKNAAIALQKVQAELQKLGYGLKIFDAYRPYQSTVLMWNLIKDERYVANPKTGSNHNRGLAVDVTIVDNKGIELNMGTGFDNFTDTAHHNFVGLPNTIITNRKLLKNTMEQYGFKALDTEWWHYSYSNNSTAAVFDLSFKLLRKIME